MKSVSMLVSAFLAWSPTLHAVVVASGAPNTSAPDGQPFFNHIGIVNGASGIYLGNGWMLTAAHVAQSLPGGTISLAGSSYSALEGTYRRLHNPTGYTEFTDLALFRLTSDPGLPSLGIASVSPTVGAAVMMIGNGLDQQSTRTFWDVTEIQGNNNDTWLEVTEGSHNREGYQTLNSSTIRWGENNVAANGLVISLNRDTPSQVDVISFTTSFDLGAKTHEAQAINGDSGGAVFVEDGGTWTLAGVMFAIGTSEKQPEFTSVFGNETAIADLSVYRSEILSLIPEPGSALLCLIGSLLATVRRQR